MIPEEISFDKPIPPPPSKYIYNLNKYQADLQSQRIDPFEDVDTQKGRVYYKNPLAYYGPKTTYKNIPEVKDVKFSTPVVVAELENLDDKESLKRELEDTEKELAHKLLFINLPKKVKHLKQNDFLPYYDPTYEDKEIKVHRLKSRILQLRHYLNINDDNVNFFVEVRNATYPHGPMDILNHLNDSYYYEDEYDSKKDYNITNGKYKKLNDIYKERNSHLKKNFDAHDEAKMLNSLKYH